MGKIKIIAEIAVPRNKRTMTITFPTQTPTRMKTIIMTMAMVRRRKRRRGRMRTVSRDAEGPARVPETAQVTPGGTGPPHEKTDPANLI